MPRLRRPITEMDTRSVRARSPPGAACAQSLPLRSLARKRLLAARARLGDRLALARLARGLCRIILRGLGRDGRCSSTLLDGKAGLEELPASLRDVGGLGHAFERPDVPHLRPHPAGPEGRWHGPQDLVFQAAHALEGIHDALVVHLHDCAPHRAHKVALSLCAALRLLRHKRRIAPDEPMRQAAPNQT